MSADASPGLFKDVDAVMAEFDDLPRYVVDMVVAYARQQEIEAKKKPLTSAEKRRLKAVGRLPETAEMKDKRAFQKMLQAKGVSCGDVVEIDDAVTALPADYYETPEYAAKYAAYEALATKNCAPVVEAEDELSALCASTAL